MGLSDTRIKSAERRDRLLMLCALAYVFIMLLGEAGERSGVSAMLAGPQKNKKRVYSLFKQGQMFLDLLPTMKPHRKDPLLAAFDELLREHHFAMLMISHFLDQE